MKALAPDLALTLLACNRGPTGGDGPGAGEGGGGGAAEVARPADAAPAAPSISAPAPGCIDVIPEGRRFLSRWFSSNKGMLYEGTYWCDIVPGNIKPGIDDSGCLTREFAPSACSPQAPDEDTEDDELLRQFAQKIQELPQGQFYPTVTSFFELDTFLSQWAVDSLIGHWDGYEFSIMNNYRLYHNPANGKWTIIPTGVDQTFSADQDPWGVAGVIAARCTAEPMCNEAFAARLKEVNALFQSPSFDDAGRAKAIHDQITPGILADPRKEYNKDEFTKAHEQTLGFIAARPAQVQKHLAAHGF